MIPRGPGIPSKPRVPNVLWKTIFPQTLQSGFGMIRVDYMYCALSFFIF